VIQRVWKERKEAADDGLRPLFRTFGPVASPSLWLNALVKGIKQQRDEITASSLIDEYTGNNLADEDIDHPEAGPLWEKFRIIAGEMIPVISQFDDLEHSLIWLLTCRYITDEHYDIAKAFALGWEGGCERLPSPQLSTFIDHYRTYLFKDHIATIECYMHDYLIPVLEQIDQRSDRGTPLGDRIVGLAQTWKNELDLAIDRRALHTWGLFNVRSAMVFFARTLASGEYGKVYSLEELRVTFGNDSLWGLLTNISESAIALQNTIWKGWSFCKEILLPFTSSRAPSGELIKSASPY
jgi:hypothetical protein